MRVLTPKQTGTGLGGRVHDPRGTGSSLGLSSGVPVPVFAEGPDTARPSCRIHAGWLEGHEQLWNARLEAAFDGRDRAPGRRGHSRDRGLRGVP
ncbi:hypothetical protein A6A08_00770 [Nocardiopsis sp. TSRI0078]|nr:hypothetical protein A6A08_00770 [Nocardiopsis sp. TSRI0078]